MFQFVLDQALTDRQSAPVFRWLRRLVLRRYDPIVHWKVNGQRCAMNLSHDLPFYKKLFPTYSANLTRLATFVRDYFGMLRMIDVGANVGDSYFLTQSGADDEYLLIEGDPHFFDLLKTNTQHNPLVARALALLSNEFHTSWDQLVSVSGNTQIIENSATAAQVTYRTLDDVVAEHPKFEQSNLLKTDVEGYDGKVLVGGTNLIKGAKPIIFFEHHPRLLAQAREDDSYIFPLLSELGYSRLIVYDNFGYLQGSFDTDDSQTLRDLNYYAKQKHGYYYDVCCINDEHHLARDSFLNRERGFYQSLIS